MVGKTYEQVLKVSDPFSEVTVSLNVYTKAKPVEIVETEFDASSLLLGQTVEVELEEEEDEESGYLTEEEFFAQYSYLFDRKGEVPVQESLDDMYELLATPLPMITSIDNEGLLQIKFSSDILIPITDEQGKFAEILTEQHTIDLTLETSEGFVILGSPYVSENLKLEVQNE